MASRTKKTQRPGRFTEVILDHKLLVGHYMQQVIGLLVGRAIVHDFSKFEPEEYGPYEDALPRFEASEYGTPEYIAVCRSIKPALKHHFEANSHHPEHYEDGIAEMDLLDLVEMVCDWMAACQRGGGTLDDLRLDLQRERFKIEPQLASVIQNTVTRLRSWSGE
jgi:hypothetical protein